MTHYTLVVFDDGLKLEELLAPYDEKIEVAPYAQCKVTVDDWRNFLNHYLVEAKPYDKENPLNGKTLEEFVDEFGDDWDGRKWVKNADGVWEKWTTYNPASKWDYWQPITDEADKRDLPEWTPYSFVTPDGVWHTKGRIGWWAVSWDEKTDAVWDKEYKDALKNYKGSFVLVDCHI
jgi:hypothetical protein